GPMTAITPNSTATIALIRVKTLARMICPTVRLARTGTSLPSPAASRCAACAEVNPTSEASGSAACPSCWTIDHHPVPYWKKACCDNRSRGAQPEPTGDADGARSLPLPGDTEEQSQCVPPLWDSIPPLPSRLCWPPSATKWWTARLTGQDSTGRSGRTSSVVATPRPAAPGWRLHPLSRQRRAWPQYSTGGWRNSPLRDGGPCSTPPCLRE